MSYSIFWVFFCDSCLQYHHYQSLGSTHVKGMRLNNLFIIIVVVFFAENTPKMVKMAIFWSKMAFLTIILTFFNLVLFDIYNTDQMCFTEYFLIHRAPFYSVLCPSISYLTGPLKENINNYLKKCLHFLHVLWIQSLMIRQPKNYPNELCKLH